MKKSLSVLVAGAMVSSMFASIAFAADAPLTTQQKLDALIAAGIFDKDGTGQGSELDKNMTREQLAKILAKLLTLKEETGTSYGDVAADRWSAGFIAAVTKAKLMEGQWDGVFNPAGNVTLEELATVAVRALGLKAAAGDVKGTVSDWAKDYVATAIKNALLAEKSDYTKAALRSELVETSYTAKLAVDAQKEPEKASVKSVKQAGATSVEVTLDKTVDTAKATFTLKKGANDVPLNAVVAADWSADKKTVKLKLKDTKLSAGDYTVTLGGLEATAIDKATGTFTAENEKVVKMEFKSASDTIAKSNKARVEVVPTNQFGEAATSSQGSYTVYATTPADTADAATITKTADGKLFVVVDTDYPNVIPGSSQVSITVTNTEQYMTVSKLFKIGDAPLVSKIELGAVTYKNGKSSLALSGDTAVIAMTQYDQYGGVISADSGSPIKPSVYVTPYNEAISTTTPAEIKDDNNDNIQDVVLTLGKNVEKSEEITVSVFGGGSTATAKVKLEASKVAAKVELVQPQGTFANGDNDKYVELVAYDEAGNKLTADDIVDNAKLGRFKITASSNLILGQSTEVPQAMLVNSPSDVAQAYKIVQAGPNKGKIHVAEVNGKGQGNMFVALYANGTSSTSQINIALADVRYPDSIRVVTEGANKAVAGAQVKPKYALYDQYGEKITAFSADNSTSTAKPIEIIQNGKSVTYDVYATVTTSDATHTSVIINSKTLTNNGSTELSITDFSDKEITINTQDSATPVVKAAAGTTVDVKFELRKREASINSSNVVVPGNVVDPSVTPAAVKKVSIITSEAIKNLTYSMNALGDIFNTLDDATLPKDHATENNILTSKLAKEVVVSAKDASGAAVALPKTITSVTQDVYNIVNTQANGTGSAFVLGNKVGTANVTAYFTDGNDQLKYVSGPVNVKNEANQVVTLAAGSATKTFTTSEADGENLFFLMNGLTVTNQYGNTFKSEGSTKVGAATATTDRLQAYDAYFGVRYIISDVTGVTIDRTGAHLTNNTIGVSGTGSFVITAVAANGKTAMTTVVVK